MDEYLLDAAAFEFRSPAAEGRPCRAVNVTLKMIFSVIQNWMGREKGRSEGS